jgi:hypothetical protein
MGLRTEMVSNVHYVHNVQADHSVRAINHRTIDVLLMNLDQKYYKRYENLKAGQK